MQRICAVICAGLANLTPLGDLRTNGKPPPKLGTKLGPKPPKYRVKRGSGRYQKARRVNNIDFLA